MGPGKILIIYQQKSDWSALRSILFRERYDVIDASLDMGTAPVDVKNCCLVVLDPLAAAPGVLGLQPGYPRNGPPTSSLGSVRTGQQRLVRRKPRQMQRKAHSSRKSVKLGDKTVALSTRVVRGSVGEVRLTRFEYSILDHLLAHVNQSVPSMDLVRKLWPSDPTKGVHSLRAFIKNLRRKIEPDPAHPQYIVTDLAIGYRLRLSPPGRDR